MNYCPQITRSSCGITCVKNLMYFLTKNENYLNEKIDESLDYTTYQEMIDYGEKIGLQLEGVKCKEKSNLLSNVKRPFIVSIIEGETKHSIIILKVRKKFVKVFDPGRGLLSIKKIKLMEKLDGKALLVRKYNVESHKPMYYFNNKFVIVYKFLLTVIFSVLTFLCAYKDINKRLGLLLLLTVFTCFIPLSIAIKRIIDNVENITFTKITSLEENKETVNRMERYKENTLFHPIKSLSSLALLIIMFFNTKVCLESSVLFIVPILLYLVKKLINKIKVNDRSNQTISTLSIQNQYHLKNGSKLKDWLLSIISIAVYVITNILLFKSNSILDILTNVGISILFEQIIDSMICFKQINYCIKKDKYLLINSIND